MPAPNIPYPAGLVINPETGGVISPVGGGGAPPPPSRAPSPPAPEQSPPSGGKGPDVTKPEYPEKAGPFSRQEWQQAGLKTPPQDWEMRGYGAWYLNTRDGRMLALRDIARARAATRGYTRAELARAPEAAQPPVITEELRKAGLKEPDYTLRRSKEGQRKYLARISAIRNEHVIKAKASRAAEKAAGGTVHSIAWHLKRAQLPVVTSGKEGTVKKAEEVSETFTPTLSPGAPGEMPQIKAVQNVKIPDITRIMVRLPDNTYIRKSDLAMLVKSNPTYATVLQVKGSKAGYDWLTKNYTQVGSGDWVSNETLQRVKRDQSPDAYQTLIDKGADAYIRDYENSLTVVERFQNKDGSYNLDEIVARTNPNLGIYDNDPLGRIDAVARRKAAQYLFPEDVVEKALNRMAMTNYTMEQYRKKFGTTPPKSSSGIGGKLSSAAVALVPFAAAEPTPGGEALIAVLLAVAAGIGAYEASRQSVMPTSGRKPEVATEEIRPFTKTDTLKVPAIQPVRNIQTNENIRVLLIPDSIKLGGTQKLDNEFINRLRHGTVSWKEPVVILSDGTPIPKSLIESANMPTAERAKMLLHTRLKESPLTRQGSQVLEQVLQQADKKRVDAAIRTLESELSRLEAMNQGQLRAARRSGQRYLAGHVTPADVASARYAREAARAQIAQLILSNKLSSAARTKLHKAYLTYEQTTQPQVALQQYVSTISQVTPLVMPATQVQQATKAQTQEQQATQVQELTQTKTQQQAATKTATATQTETQTEARTQTQTATTPAVSTTAATTAAEATKEAEAEAEAEAENTLVAGGRYGRIPHLRGGYGELSASEKKSAVAWSQGFGWWVLFRRRGKWMRFFSYGQEPPPGIKTVRQGKGEAYRSIQELSGNKAVSGILDLGIEQVRITRPSRLPGKPGAISFSRRSARITARRPRLPR